jgi:hypothetical protein
MKPRLEVRRGGLSIDYVRRRRFDGVDDGVSRQQGAIPVTDDAARQARQHNGALPLLPTPIGIELSI